MSAKNPSVWDVHRHGIPVVGLSGKDWYRSYPTLNGFRRFAIVEILTPSQKPTNIKRVLDVTTEEKLEMCFIYEINGGHRIEGYFLLPSNTEEQHAA